MKKIFFLLIAITLFSKNITKEFLQDKPRSTAKDFYLWRYLKQNITPQDALWALSQAKNPNYRLFYLFAQKYNHKPTKYIAKCIKIKNAKYFINQTPECIAVGLSTYKATKLTKNQLNKIISKIKPIYPTYAKKYEILSSNEPFIALIHSDTDTFFDTFNQCGSRYREKYFNHHLPLKLLYALSKNKKKFSTTIKLIVTNPKLTELKYSLLHIKNTTNLDHFSVFFLAINAIELKKYTLAKTYLSQALKKAWYKFDIDKTLFWQYQLTKNKQILHKLAKSWDVNIYSIYAKERLNQKFTNIYYDIPQSGKKSPFDYTNQFEWIKILNQNKKVYKCKLDFYKEYFSDNYTIGHLAFLYERFYKYKKQFFVTPFNDIIKHYPKKRQALIYAIMRQESRYIPSSISTSYALGAMQIMPFLSKAIAKKLHHKYDIDKQLDPKVNIPYANFHLNYLQKKLHNPLFIAYAYNGGIGFTKRLLKTHFKHKKFDPFLSMELVPYSESKRYGKKVLANYWVYINKIQKTLFSQLINEI